MFVGLFLMGCLALGASAATISWGLSPDEATGKVLGYKVYYSTTSFSVLPSDADTNTAFTTVTVPAGQTSVTLNNLTGGKTY